MADGTHIEWADATWNIVTGCQVVSPGCTNCYAMRLAGTRLRHHPSRAGLTRDTKAGPVWTGDVRFNEQWLDQPLRWQKPRRIFVCAHGDLFADGAHDEWIDRVFAVMALAPQHIFMVLTKRAPRMREYLTASARAESIGWAEAGIAADDLRVAAAGYNGPVHERLPLPNVWLGVSVENQAHKHRINELRATPASKRFLSLEPLLQDLGAIDLAAAIDWVIVGGESGPAARPMHPDWARSLRDQCQAAGVPFFFKQWGAWGPIDHSDAADEAGWRGRGDWMILYQDGDMDIPDHRWPDEQTGEVAIVRVGKRAAGRLLDGREWNEVPG